MLKDAELLYERGLFPDSSLIFKHALTRQVVYETLLERKKKELHTNIGRAMEEVYKDALEERFGSLADHFSHSSDSTDLAKAVKYGEMAAQRATSVYAFGETVKLLDQSIKVQEVLDPEDKVKRCDLLLNLCNALGNVPDTRRVLEVEAPTAYALAETMGDGSRAAMACLRALTAIFTEKAVPGFATPEAAKWIDQLDYNAKPGTRERILADMYLGTSKVIVGNMQGIKLLTNAADLARKMNHTDLFWSAGGMLLVYRVAPHHVQENMELAEELLSGWADLLANPPAGWSAMRVIGILQWIGNAFLVVGMRQRAEEA